MTSSRLTCEEARELAPEVALGIVSGDDRARVLTHIATCSGCRSFVERLSETADSILLFAPRKEPPAGFESGVLAQFKLPTRRRAVAAAVLAAACVAAIASGGGILWATSDEREVAHHYEEALAEADGEYFGVKPLTSEAGSKVANVFVYEGSPSWAFVVFEESPAPGRYRATVETRGGDTFDMGTYDPEDGGLTWGGELPVRLRSVAAFSLSGPEVLTARFPAP